MSLVTAAAVAIRDLFVVLQVAVASLSSLNLGQSLYPPQANIPSQYHGQKFDFIIVGGGSAGCVVANRLTEITGWSVLLIEAGDLPTIASDVPGLFSFVNQTWNYTTVNDEYSAQAHKTKNIHMNLGKLLGGTSSTNGMFYVRGNKADYENWVKQGNEGWDWENVTAYFKKSERFEDEDILNSESANLHNTEGLLGVTKSDWKCSTKQFFEAFKENGHDILLDTNGNKQIGYSAPQFTAACGQRQSTAASFIKPIRNRRNLYLLKNSLAQKIIFNKNKRAIGVEISLADKNVVRVMSRKEVIVSAGAINSPKLLMLSGLGPKDHLKDMGIKVIRDSPKVGSNLKDHMTVYLTITGERGIDAATRNIDTLVNLDKYPYPVLLGQIPLNKTDTYPDYEVIINIHPPLSPMSYLYCSNVIGLAAESCEVIAKEVKESYGIAVLLTIHSPESSGVIRLKSNEPTEMPLIYTGHFSSVKDLDRIARSIEDFLSVLNTTYFRRIKSKVVNIQVKQCEDFEFGSFEYWKCFALNTVNTAWHLVGTCAMGPDGVVDERLRVRGVTGLRVVDASVIPTMISANTNAPVIMVGEKAADMIKIDHGINIEAL